MAKKGGSNLSAEQLRALFAKGVLRHGKGQGGKRGKVIFDKARDREIKKMQGKGNAGSTYRLKGSRHTNAKEFASRQNHNTNAAKANPFGNGRMVIGGKGAGLRGSGNGGEKPKVDHSATRAQRIATGRAKAGAAAARAAVAPFRNNENELRRVSKLLNASSGVGGYRVKERARLIDGVLKRGFHLPSATQYPTRAAQFAGTRAQRVSAAQSKRTEAFTKGIKVGSAKMYSTKDGTGYGIHGAYSAKAVKAAKLKGGRWRENMWVFGSAKEARAYAREWYR